MVADIFLSAEIDDNGSAARLAAIISGSIEKSFAKLGPKLANEFAQTFKKAFSKTSGFDEAFGNMAKGAGRFNDELRTLQEQLDALARGIKANGQAFSKDFNPRNLDGLESALEEIIRLQDQLAKSGGNNAGFLKASSQRTQLLKSEALAQRVLAQQAIKADTDRANASARNTNQISRAQSTALKAASGQAVAQLQTASAKEVAIIKSGAQQQVAATQAAAKRRAATFALVATAARSSERVIRSVFDNTGNVVSSAFRSMQRAATTTTTNIRQSFTTAGNSLSRSVNNANSNITNSYSRSFRKNTSIVNQEMGKQETRVREFAREASEEVSSIGLGRLGAFAAIGVLAGKALSGGFQRATTLETAELALTKLLGSAEKAKKLLTEVTEVVTGTPFALDQFAAATSQLIAYNVEAERIPGILAAVGDASALAGANSAQSFDSILRSIGQITTVGRANLEEIKVIAEAGVPAFKILGNALGVTTEELRDLFEKGLVPADVAVNALVSGITNGTDGVNGATAAFGGLAKELGGTLAGSVANMRTSLNRLGAGIITAFKEPFTLAAGAATAAIDLLGSALKSLSTAIQNSATFQLLQRGLVALTAALKNAKQELTPFFEFISGGLVVVGQFAVALFALKRIPAVLKAVGAAFKFILAPTHLLIAAGVLVVSYFKDLYDRSGSLRTALGEVGAVIKRIATVIKDLAVDAFETLTGGVKAAGETTGGFAVTVLNVVVPALEKLADFLLNEVLPRVRDFAKLVRTEVLPAVGRFLATAVDRAREAFGKLADIIGPILTRAVEIGRNALAGFVEFITAAFNIITKGGTTLSAEGWLSYDGPIVRGLFAIREAFKSIYEFLSGTVVPFIQSNLIPVLAGLGAAVGALALTGGNLPLAGLVGVGAAIVAAVTNEDIRTRIVTFFGEVVDNIQAKFKELFDGDTLETIGVGVLKVARKIGQVLGNAFTDRGLITVVAAAAAAAAAVAAAFVLGLGEGIVSNLPDLVDMIGDALSAAFLGAIKVATSDPKIALAVVGAFFGARAIAKLVLAARQSGKVLAQALKEGTVTAGAIGGGGGPGGFLTGLFGGPGAIRQAGAQAGQQYGQSLSQAIRNEARVIQKLGGNLPSTPLGLGRVAGESFVTQNKRLAETYKELTKETGRLGSELGTAAVSGVRLREGLSQITSGNIRQGLSQIGTAIRNSGREIATTAGIIAGGAFAASFVARAIFDINSSGSDKLAAGIGLLATSVATGAAIGGTPGAVAGAAVGAFGLLTSKLQANGQAAKEAKARIQEYADAIRDAAKEQLPDLFEKSAADRALDDLSGSAQDALSDIGFSFEELGEAIAAGTSADLVGPLDETVQQVEILATSLEKGFRIGIGKDSPFGLAQLQALNLSPLVEQLLASGASADDVNQIIKVLGGTLTELGVAQDDAARKAGLLGEAGDRTGRGMDYLRQQTVLATGAAKVGEAATQAYKDKLNELNDVRIQGLKDKVAEAKSGLDLAKGAADSALSSLTAFLSGGNTIGSSVDQAIVSTAGLSRQIGELGPEASTAGGEIQSQFNIAFAGIKENMATVIAEGLQDNPGMSKEEAEGLLQPIADVGGTVGADALAAVLAEFDSEDGIALRDDFFDASGAITALETELESAELELSVGIDLPAGLFYLIEEEARTAFKTAGEESSAGYVEGIDGEAMKTAAKDAADLALAGAEEALDTGSPSQKFAELGLFSAQGYAQGIQGATGLILNATRQVGLFAMQGFRIGILMGAPAVLQAARAVALAAAAAMRSALVISSPSKVTTEIGEYFGEGLAEGIEDSTDSVLAAAVRLAKDAIAPLAAAGRAAAKAIGKGFAEEGPSFVRSIGSAMDDALDAAASKAEQFKAIGGEIARNLFTGQGVGAFGASDRSGGGVEASLQKAYYDIRASTRSFRDALQANVDKATAYFGGNTDAGRSFGASLDFGETGEENRSAFLQAGLNIRDYIGEVLESGRSIEEALAAARFQRNDLLAVADSFGITRSVVDDLIRTLGLSDDQLNTWAASVNNVTVAAEAATAAENRRIEIEREAERAAEQAAKDAEAAKLAAAEAARVASVAGPAFRDLVIQTPTSDPEAVALYVANRVALSARR